jgi:undecaprenyl-diphosphatase
MPKGGILSTAMKKKAYSPSVLVLISFFTVLMLGVFLGVTNSIDFWAVDALYKARDAFGLTIFSLITRLADTWAIGSMVALTSMLLLLSKKDRAWILGLIVAVAGAKITEVAIKILIGRERPDGFALLQIDTFSFPSGHATAAMALFGFIAYLLWQYYPRAKVFIFVLAAALIALVGMSRVYIGVHYPSDVAGGFLLGYIWVLVGIGVVRYWRS